MASTALAFRPHRGIAPPLRLLPEPEPQDWGPIPRGQLWRSVSFRAKAILGTLGLLSRGRAEFRTSLAEIQEELGVCTEGSDELCSESTIRRGLKELEKAGAVEIADMGRNFALLFRLKGRSHRQGSVFRAPGVLSDLTGSPSDLTPPPHPPIEEENKKTTTRDEESSSSFSSPEEIDALVEEAAKLWPRDANSQLRSRVVEAHDAWPWPEQRVAILKLAVEYARLMKGDRWRYVLSTVERWRKDGYSLSNAGDEVEAERPKPARPATVNATAPAVKLPPTDPDAAAWFSKAWRSGAFGAQKKPAAEPGTSFPRDRPQMAVSRGDSSVYRGTEQVSLRDPALRSDLSARDLLPCSRESSFPPKPAAPGGG